MERDIPLKIEILSSGKDDPYRITLPKEIEFILHGIAKSGSSIALYYSEANDYFLTSLLAVDATGLWLAQSSKAEENQSVINNKKLIIVSSHGQVKVQFSADQIRAENYHGQAALFLPLPHSIHRLQRREYFRLTTPVSNPLLCVIPATETVEHCPHEITIMDISGGGVGLTCTEQDTVLIPGHTYDNCRIDLLDIGEFVGTIEVKNLVVLSTSSGETVRRAGCEFKHLDGASTILLQRYVTTMQRAKRD